MNFALFAASLFTGLTGDVTRQSSQKQRTRRRSRRSRCPRRFSEAPRVGATPVVSAAAVLRALIADSIRWRNPASTNNQDHNRLSTPQAHAAPHPLQHSPHLAYCVFTYSSYPQPLSHVHIPGSSHTAAEAASSHPHPLPSLLPCPPPVQHAHHHHRPLHGPALAPNGSLPSPFPDPGPPAALTPFIRTACLPRFTAKQSSKFPSRVSLV